MVNVGMERRTVGFAEACNALGIHRETGYALLAKGEFPVTVHRLGRLLKVSRADLDALLGPAPVRRRRAGVA